MVNGVVVVDDDGEGWGNVWGIGDDELLKEELKEVEKKVVVKLVDDGDEDVVDVWGWGDEVVEEE